MPDTLAKPELQELVREILVRLGEDPSREGLKKTPLRVEKALAYLTRGYQQDAESDDTEEKSETSSGESHSSEAPAEDRARSEERPKDAQDLRELFNAWNSLDDEGEPDEISGSEVWSQSEIPEQGLDAGEEAFAYDEWDRELNDYRVGWSRVIEKRVKKGDRGFVELARSRYRGVISSIRHQFQLMKPENLTKINRELDGEDYDLNSLVDFVIDRKADGRQSENIYTKRLRKRRDVAVSLLLDQSSSTARTITRNPLQPYTYPGRRIIEIEKDAARGGDTACGEQAAASGIANETPHYSHGRPPVRSRLR
jgi:nitric oxide reductase activation protein